LRQLYEKFNGKDDRMIVDGVDYMHDALKAGNKRIIAEGANATMLDIDFGTYPYVTSSSTGIGGVFTGLGVPPQAVETTIGIMKAYTTRVGAGPFPTWLEDEIGDRIQKVGVEFGATTGRKRKCGWLDLNVVKYSHKLNGFHSLNITKLDVLSGIKKLKVATHYELNGKRLDGSMPGTVQELAQCKTIYADLPGWDEDISKASKFSELPINAQNYIKFIEKETNIPITWIGNGPKREEMFLR
jgi:adenylosuccinate synthase